MRIPTPPIWLMLAVVIASFLVLAHNAARGGSPLSAPRDGGEGIQDAEPSPSV
jgi:hypothetical protein